MKVVKELHDGVSTLTLKGDFDSYAAGPFLEEIEAILEQGVSRIVLNMRLVRFVNSTAIGAMLKGRKRCRAQDGNLMVVQPSRHVRDTLDALGLAGLLDVHEGDGAARKVLV